jgi:hypothetical protein
MGEGQDDVRRQFLHLATSITTLPALSRFARPQAYPSHPITMIVPYPAGGPADVVGRIVAGGMRVRFVNSIIVENIGGPDGTIGIGRAARAKADGLYDCPGYQQHAGARQVLNGALYSQGTVCKILDQDQVKPHKVRYYLEQRDPDFAEKMAAVLCVYRQVKVLKRRAQRIYRQGCGYIHCRSY